MALLHLLCITNKRQYLAPCHQLALKTARVLTRASTNFFYRAAMVLWPMILALAAVYLPFLRLQFHAALHDSLHQEQVLTLASINMQAEQQKNK